METTPRPRRRPFRRRGLLGAALLALPLLWGGWRVAVSRMDLPRLIIRPPLPVLPPPLEADDGGHGAAAVAVSPDGGTIWSGGALAWAKVGRTTYLSPTVLPICAWDGRTGALRYTLPGHRRVVEALACSPDGRRLASGGWDGTVKMWDIGTRRMLWSRPCSVPTLAFSPDGSLLAGGSAVWDAATGTPFRVRGDHGVGPPPSAAAGTAFSPDGRTLARVSSDLKLIEPSRQQREASGWPWHKVVGHRLQLWDVASGRLRETLPYDQTDSATFSPDGRWIACVADGDDVSYASVIRVVDAATGAARWRSGRGSDADRCTLCLAYSPNGKWLAAGQMDHSVVLFDAATGLLVKRLRACELPHAGDVNYHSTLAFSRDGRTLVGCGDSTVQVWDTGSLL